MPILGFIHSPCHFKHKQDPHALRYYCHVLTAQVGERLHHNDLLILIEFSEVTVPVLGTTGQPIALPAHRWQIIFKERGVRLIDPGESVIIRPKFDAIPKTGIAPTHLAVASQEVCI